jgi:hypothetical protein
MSSYQSQREKIRNYIEEKIVLNLKERELDYYKFIGLSAQDLGVSESLVIDVLRSFINSERLECVLRLSVDEIIKQNEKYNNETKENLKKAGLE